MVFGLPGLSGTKGPMEDAVTPCVPPGTPEVLDGTRNGSSWQEELRRRLRDIERKIDVVGEQLSAKPFQPVVSFPVPQFDRTGEWSKLPNPELPEPSSSLSNTAKMHLSTTLRDKDDQSVGKVQTMALEEVTVSSTLSYGPVGATRARHLESNNRDSASSFDSPPKKQQQQQQHQHQHQQPLQLSREGHPDVHRETRFDLSRTSRSSQEDHQQPKKSWLQVQEMSSDTGKAVDTMQSHTAWAVGAFTTRADRPRLSKIRWQFMVQNEQAAENQLWQPCKTLLEKVGIPTWSVEVVEGHEPRGWKWVHGPLAQSLCSLMILLNAFFIGHEAAVSLDAEVQNTSVDGYVYFIETAFEIFFLVELLCRVGLEGPALFCRGPEARWNIFDMVLILLSSADVLITGLAEAGANNLILGRLLRILRFLRLTRLMRVIRKISSLRLVLFSIFDSMSSLFWCFLVIFWIIYVFGILFMNATLDYISSHGPTQETSVLLLKWFGNVDDAMVSLFMVITGGVDWIEVEQPLKAVNHWLYGGMFWFFVFLMQFGVLNVVVGTFVATAAEIASRDRDVMVRRELQQMVTVAQRIRTFFQEADVNGSGTLSWTEFKAHLEKKEVKAYFNSMDLDVSQAHLLFCLLDTDENNVVTIDEFVDGCLRLKGQARNIDINVLIAAHRKLSEQLHKFMEGADLSHRALEFKLGALEHAISGRI